MKSSENTIGPKPSACPWADNIGHLALVVSDIEKAKWFFSEVLMCPYFVFRETQLIAHIGSSLLVFKLSKDAVDKERQNGAFGCQVLDHYGFCAPTRERVDDFYQHILQHALLVVKPPYDREDGRAFYFRDPFGNLVEYLWYKG